MTTKQYPFISFTTALDRPDSDASGNGIKPFAINEMSMLAHYHEIEPKELMLLPVVPAHDYILNKYVCNMSFFGPGGSEV